MRLKKNVYDKLDAVFKIAGLVLLAIGVDNVPRGNYSLAIFFFSSGALMAIIPLYFLKAEGSE